MVAIPASRTTSVSEAPSELSERYEALIRVSQAIGAHRDPKDLFGAMATELHRVVQFDGIVVAQYDEASNEIVWNACEVCSHQGPASPPDIPADETITKWVFLRQEPLVIPSLEQESRFPQMMAFLKQAGFQSLCVLPLTTVHRRIGSIGVASKRENAYSKEEVRFLSLVADQVALAIDDALNFDASQAAQAQLERKSERLKLLLEVNNTIVSNLELRRSSRGHFGKPASRHGVRRCRVALPDSESQHLRVHALDFPNSKGVFPEEIRIAIDDDSPAARVYRTGEPVSLVAGDSSWTPLPPEGEGVESLCHVALISRGRTLGLLSLVRLAPVPFSPRDLEFLGMVANQVAIAVENALAYREIAELKDRLARENVYLEDEIRSELNFDEIVGRSPALRSVLQEIETVAPTDSTVLDLRRDWNRERTDRARDPQSRHPQQEQLRQTELRRHSHRPAGKRNVWA